jgi:cellulose synthase/poly-beta-1,6-N-acetylglucosamine synthase-like glycosyltransferase
MAWFESIPILYLLVGNTLYLGLILFGFINSRRRYAERQLDIVGKLAPLRVLPPVSVLVPAHNEEKSIVDSVKSMLRMNYPDFEVIVCNDGSSDATLERLIEAFRLVPVDSQPPRELPCAPLRTIFESQEFQNLVVIDKKNGGKSDALNAAINLSQHPLVCCVDADSLLEGDGLMQAAEPFFEDFENTCAVGGVIRIANGSLIENGRVVALRVPWSWSAMIQVAEYLRAFLAGRMGWDFLGCNLIISGAFGLFRKDMIVRVGGFSTETVGEDFELLMRMQAYCLEHQENYRVYFLSTPVCWTEAPKDLVSLRNQRSRWSQGLAETLWKHRRVLFRRWSGKLGWLALPYLWIFELLSAPMEILGATGILGGAALGKVSLNVAGLFIAAWLFYGWILTVLSLLIEEFTFSRYQHPSDVFKIILGSLLEQFGFRQLNLYWRTRGLFHFLAGKRQWGEIQRVGFSPA